MKNQPLLKVVLISFMGFIVVLNCNSQPDKENRLDRKKLKQAERQKSYESLSLLINSRTFVFESQMTKNNHGSALYDNPEYEASIIRLNGSKAFIVSPSIPIQSKTTSYEIKQWYLQENPDKLTYSIYFYADANDSGFKVSLKIYSDNTAVAQFYGCEFKGRISSN